MSFEVWAPIPSRVTLLLDGVRHPMTRGEGGWWTAPEGLSGERYGYLLDDDPTPLPDPRSRRQPGTVHDLSAVVPASPLEPFSAPPLAGSVIYELHLGTFTALGTLDSAIERLDHLVSLGVDFVELLPVNGFSGTHNWGYDGVLWYAVDETYGGPDAYRHFVAACHHRGLGVIQDVVYNHLGPSGNYLPRFGPYVREGSANTWGDSINFDERPVRDYVIDNALMWLVDYGIDGLRLDAVHAIVDTSPTHILKELAERVAPLGKPLIAESDLNDTRLLTDNGLDAQWSDDFHHALHVAVSGETGGYYADFRHLDALAKVFEHGFFHDGIWSSFREREHGRPIDTGSFDPQRLVVAAQNHDQVGNRVRGDRPSEYLGTGQLAVSAVMTLMSPFTPMLFMGEEWGATTPWQFFTAHPEPELAATVAKGRVAEFARLGWGEDAVPDPQDPETFRRSKLDWSAANGPLLDLYRQLIVLRREVGASGFATVEYDDAARWLAFHRGDVTVVANFGAASVALPYTGELLLATDPAISLGERLELPGHAAAVLRFPGP